MTHEQAVVVLKNIHSGTSTIMMDCNNEQLENNLLADCEALTLAIDCIGRRIAKRVDEMPWTRCACPTCGEELSDHKGDGYYKHYKHLSVCPNEECLQALEWDD